MLVLKIDFFKVLNKEKVNHPNHYNSGKFEAIDVIADAGYGEGFLFREQNIKKMRLKI